MGKALGQGAWALGLAYFLCASVFLSAKWESHDLTELRVPKALRWVEEPTVPGGGRANLSGAQAAPLTEKRQGNPLSSRGEVQSQGQLRKTGAWEQPSHEGFPAMFRELVPGTQPARRGGFTETSPKGGNQVGRKSGKAKELNPTINLTHLPVKHPLVTVTCIPWGVRGWLCWDLVLLGTEQEGSRGKRGRLSLEGIPAQRPLWPPFVHPSSAAHLAHLPASGASALPVSGQL